MTYEAQTNNSGRIDPEQPALVLLEDGTVIEAAHQFVNDSGQLCVYLGARDLGVDIRINLDIVTAVITSEDAAVVFDVEDEFHEGTSELVADGGSVITPGDRVTHNRRMWTVARTNTSYAELYAQDASTQVVSLKEIQFSDATPNWGEGSW